MAPNGGFELRGSDGWVQGWEKLQLTADCTVEAAEVEPGNWAVRIVGKSRLSKGGLRAPLQALDGPPVVRVMLRYRGTQGRRSVVLRPKGIDPADAKAGERFGLEPSRSWRPGGGMLSLALADEEPSGELEIMLLHEGLGETWFDDVQVTSGAPQPPPETPPVSRAAFPPGPYVVHHYPDDGQSVDVNPPRFRWPGRPGSIYTLEWSSSPQFPPEATHRVEGLRLNLYIPPEPFPPGQWYWRVTESRGETPEEAPGGVPEAGKEEPSAQGTPEEAVEPTDEGAVPSEHREAATQPKQKGKPERRKPAQKARGRPPQEAPETSEDQKNESIGTTPDDEAADQAQGPASQSLRGAPGAEEVLPEEASSDESTEGPSLTPKNIESPSDAEDSEPPDLGGGLRPPFGPPPGSLGEALGHSETSAVRSFRVEDSAVILPIPSVDDILASLPSHPRVWVTLDDVVVLRGTIAGPLKTEWESLLARLDAVRGTDLPAEPKGKGKWRNPSPKDLANNQAIFDIAAKESALVRDFAFAGLLSGDQSYIDEAKRRALALAGWDPKGSTGYVSHDQAFREVFLALALTLDWLPQSLTEEEKQKIIDAVSARGNELFEALSSGPRPINLFPYSSHGQTALGFLTVAALATIGDVPEAESWLRFALPTVVALFSPWAGCDGGWMQGETYWKRSARFVFQLFDALKTAAGINLYQLPWAGQTARYKTFMHPPYSSRGGFGDGPEMPPDADDRLAMLRLASARKDPLAAWYAASVSAPASKVTAFDILARDPTVEPRAPEGEPPSAAFLDSGLFAMHSSLTDPAGVHLYGRASRFGSFNHAHADQGHFSLYAFGEPLLIDAGYYDWYRSPHATSYAGTSLAHNVLLYNGTIGQRPDDITAAGKIETFIHTQHVDYARLQLAEAYPPQLLASYRREFVFMRPDCIIVFDEVEPREKANFAWLLHSLEQPSVDPVASVATVRRGNAGVSVGAFGPSKLAWAVSKGFPKNPRFTDADAEAPTQWHMTLRSTEKVESEQLIQLLVPFQGEARAVMKRLEVQGGRGVEVEFGQWRLVTMIRVPAPPPSEPKKRRATDQKPAPEPPTPGLDEGQETTESASESEEGPGSAGSSGATAPPASGEPQDEPKEEVSPQPGVCAILPPMSGGGISVDASRLCLTTAADGSSTIFAEGIRALSRGDATLLSVTSPALLLGRLTPNLSLTIEVREAATLSINMPQSPAKIQLDRLDVPVKWADGKLTVELTAGRHELRSQ